jgi:hypothetical protein
MKRAMPVLAMLILVAGTFAISGCTSNPEQSQTNKPQANTNTAATSRPPKTTATGAISASPNPIKVCDRSGAGITTLSWTSTGTTDVEVRIGKPDGDLFARTGPNGTWKTGKWVGSGMVFYLQDVSGGKPLVPENTIASLSVAVTNEGCP